ncbi:hypothetical protein LEP3755_02030 [Leptolyngbya sp. NIES-3755]|nr:hypothetical protein LEP3755_02030 [Leptolyngbya sp. NIES-3755]
MSPLVFLLKGRVARSTLHALTVFFGFTLFYLLFFSSILFTNKLFAAGDTLTYFLPAFFAKRTLWTSLLFGGFPSLADPQMQTWYPLSVLFALFQAWNVYTVIAFVLASCFLYGYVYHLTESRKAAIVSGLTYGLSGFMISHLHHTSMIHVAAWIPLLLWSLEYQRTQPDQRWLAIGAIAASGCVLGGHPQITLYGLVSAIAYSVVLGWTAPIGRIQYYRSALITLGLGILLSAIQVIPTAEFLGLSVRSEMTFEGFISYSLPAWQLPMLLFPFFASGWTTPSLSSLYWGEWGWVELTGYIGFLPLLLTAVTVRAHPNRRLIWFWIGWGVFSLLLALGDTTPVAEWVYHLVPGYNKFRAQGRNFIIVHLAVSVLAGLGADVFMRSRIRWQFLSGMATGTSLLMASLIVGMNVYTDWLNLKAARVLEVPVSFLPWQNPAIALSTVMFVLSIATLFGLNRAKCRWRFFGVFAVLVLDLGSFGFLGYHYQPLADRSVLIETEAASRYRTLLQDQHQRVLSMQVSELNPVEFAPNLNRIWQLPNANGYSPFSLSRLESFYPMSAIAGIPDGVSNSGRSLDVAAIRYLFLLSPTVFSYSGVHWFWIDLGFSVNPTSRTVTLNVPSPGRSVDQIGVVSMLANSTAILNLTDVVEIIATDQNGDRQTVSMKAGKDTAEWAADCPDVKSRLQHSSARVFTKTLIDRGTIRCNNQDYVSLLSLPKAASIQSVTFRWLQPQGEMYLKKVSLIDTRSNRSFLLTRDAEELDGSPKWKRIETLGSSIVYENQQAMPRTWLVPEVIRLEAKTVNETIQTGRLPDGRLYDPAQVALIERSLSLKSPPLVDATATIAALEETKVTVTTDAKSPAFLVLSDVYYPGWTVKVDGKPERLYRTNYVYRGVSLSAGKHQVEFEYRPTSFHIGLGISTATAAVILYLLCKPALLPLARE